VELQVASGEVAIMDFTVPWHVRGSAQQNVMMVLPQALLEVAVPDAPRLHGRVLQGSSGWLFAEHLLALATHLPNLLQRDVTLVRNATLCLLSNAVAALPNEAPKPVPATSRALPVERIRAFINAHLTERDLDASRICRELAVTRSTLYRAFHPIGGVASYIQSRRLKAARDSIATGGVGTSIAEVADTYQFSSPAHFSTMFRRQFGQSPSELRDAPVVSGNPGVLFDTWLEVLSRTLENEAGSADVQVDEVA
jgi:AraC-like DNA-binding protein